MSHPESSLQTDGAQTCGTCGKPATLYGDQGYRCDEHAVWSTEKNARFARDYAGRYMHDLSLRDDEDSQVTDLFKCRECWALTADPILHDEWHGRSLPSAPSAAEGSNHG